MKFSHSIALCLAVLGSAGSCYKEYAEDFAEEETITRNAAIGQQLADDVLDMVYEAEVILTRDKSDTASFPGKRCGSISDQKLDKLLILDFGEGCTDSLNRTRSGKILVAYSGDLGDILADRSVTFDQYRINNKQMAGTILLHDQSIYPNGTFVSLRTLTALSISFPDGTGVTFNGSHDRVWTSGRTDTIPYNNRFTFLGSMNGVSSSGRAFTQDVVTPFISDSYAYVRGYYARTYGEVELSKLEGYPDRKRTANYGSDSTVYDHTVTITTFRRKFGVTAD